VNARVCFVLDDYFEFCQGGAELQSYLISSGLAKQGCEVHYIFVRSPEEDPTVSRGAGGTVVLHGVKSHHSRFLGRLYVLGAPELMRTLKDIDPDVVYQRTGSGFTGLVAQYTKTYRKKMIWAVASVSDCSKATLGADSRNFVASGLSRVNKWLAVYGIRRADVVVAQSNDQVKLLADNLGVEAIVIPNSQVAPQTLAPKANPPQVIWVANIKKCKRPEVFIDLAESCRDLNAEFVMVGRQGDGRYWRGVKTMIDGSDALKYLGELPYSEVNKLIEKASVLVSTSLPVEGYPNTYIQAWLRATPTVTLDFDPDEVIKTHAMGYHSRDFNQLVKDVGNLISDPELSARLGQNARAYATANHNFERVLPRYGELLDGLLNPEEKRFVAGRTDHVEEAG
jgi:glycosyltransferase involved in cell wall biosynthesis